MRTRLLATAFAAAIAHAALAQPLTTTFTFQGQLNNGGSPAAGVYDFQFALFDAPGAGSQIGPTLCSDNISLSASGTFAVQLDFGAQFAGSQRFLEVHVRQDTGLNCSNPTGFTTLGPRQNLTAAPNAVFSLNAAGATNATQLNGQPASFYTNAANLTGTLPPGDLSGTYTNTITLSSPSNSISGNGAGLTALNAGNISTGILAPARGGTGANTSGASSGQVLKWSGSAWTPGTDNDTLYSAGAGLNLAATTFSIANNGVTNAMLTSDAASLNKVSAGLMSASTGTAFVGVGRSGQVTGAEVFGLQSNVTTAGFFGGMYTQTLGAATRPFYGYSVGNGAATAYTYLDGNDSNKWKLNNGGDFLIVDRTGAVTASTLTLSGGAGTSLIFAPGSTPLITAGHDNTAPHAKRMWIAHSETFNTWGIQYRDVASDGLTSDCVEFVGGDQTRPSFGFLLAGRILNGYDSSGGTSLSLNANNGAASFAALHAQSASIDQTVALDTTNANPGNSLTDGLTFGNASGEGIASQRLTGPANNQFGLDFYTGFTRRMFVANDGRLHVIAPDAAGGDFSAQSVQVNNGLYAYTLDVGGSGTYPITLGWETQINSNLHVNGSVSKSGGSFKIDHPLDPANKYLYHSFVESPDMMNIYNGNVRTDERGYATVTLPDWFEVLNRDFRYQLTVLDESDADDAFIWAKVVRKIKDRQFTIRTSRPNVEVSWQVTGIRQDAWANAHRIPVEEDKTGYEKGRYIHPELYNQPAERGMVQQAPPPRSPVARGAPGSQVSR